MKILFDQGTPVPLRRFLHPHMVDTADERQWSSLQNGDLLNAAEKDGYEVLITTDQNLRYQHYLSGRKIHILVLCTTSWPRYPEQNPRTLWRIAARKLDLIDAAVALQDLRIPPGNRLEALSGTRKGQHSIRINQQYRICFIWTEEGPDNVEIIDYH